MKNLVKVLFASSLIMLTALITHATGNPMAGLVSASIAGAVVTAATGFSLIDIPGVASCQSLIGIKRQCNVPTIGGAKRLYIIKVEDLEEEFLNFELAMSAGKFTGAIPLLTGKKAIEVEAWFDTSKFDTEMKIGAGFTQNVEFKILGYSAENVKFAALLYETPVNLIMQGNDDQLYYIGQKYIPLMLEMKGTLPEKGTARKETTFTGKQDGMQVPVFPLDKTVTFAVEPFATEGGGQ